MNIIGYCSLALSLLAAVPAVHAEEDAAGMKKRNADSVENASRIPKKKSELVKENLNLKMELDSLKAELARIRDEMNEMDSLSLEIMDIYDENEDKSAAGLNPEDYNAEVSDSLLNIWYLQQKVSETWDDEYDMDTVKFASNVPDSVYIERIKAMNSFIDLPYNNIVRNYIVLYSEKMNERMGQVLGLCSYYMPIIEEIFDNHDIPLELKAMAVIESAMNPSAVSRAGAKGMWQFMYSTAKIYGLDINSFVDERLDPVESAHAAAEYMKDAYNIFGDWNLAIASYNCGAGNVNRAIRRSGGKRAFWDIYPYLPRETRGYVPAFVGALYTMTYYKEHGIVPKAVEMPVHVDTFKINKMLHFKQVSELVGVPMDELKNLNPQYKHEIIPGNEKEYILRIPYNYTNAFIDHEDSIYAYRKAELLPDYMITVSGGSTPGAATREQITHIVLRNENIYTIANRYGVTARDIKKWNRLSSNRLPRGKRLKLYVDNGGVLLSAQSASKAKATHATSAKQDGYIAHKVKSGESLYSIASKYPGITAQDLRKANKLRTTTIQPGQVLKIPRG